MTTDYIDPNNFIITRKRKKYRFAKFHNSPLCFEVDEWTKRPVDCVEIGAGNGMYAVEQAALQPQKTFVALDVKGDRLQKGAYVAESRGLRNVFFIRARADQVTDLFTDQSVGEIWLTFSDPYPKRRSAGRRLTAPYYLEKYKAILRTDGGLYLKHDNPTFFLWSTEQLVHGGWTIREFIDNLHESEKGEARYKILTAYEERWLAEGLQTHFLRADPPRTI